MSNDILLTLIILGISVILFITEKISVDLVALLVLSALALTKLVTPEEALSGFSSPAVVTVWAVFILSAGLTRTGIAGWLGRQLLRLGGSGDIRLMLVIMGTAGFMSAFMNNVGATAMLLPVVLDISRRTNRSPSKLLIPLAFSSLLGGMTTLIGTPPNILVTNALKDFGHQSFNFFDFGLVGVFVALGGMLFLAFFSRFLLPEGDHTRLNRKNVHDMSDAFAIHKHLFVLCLPEDSHLAGKTLMESRLGSALSLNVVGIVRNGHTELAPGPDALLQSNDRLLVTGRPDALLNLGHEKQFVVEKDKVSAADLISEDINITELALCDDSPLIGKTLMEIGFRQKYSCIVLAIWRDTGVLRSNFENVPLRKDDLLLIQGNNDQIIELIASPEFRTYRTSPRDTYDLDKRLMLVSLPEGSTLYGKTLKDSHLGDRFGLGVLGIIRDGLIELMPDPSEELQVGDMLLVKGRANDVFVLNDLQELEIDEQASPTLADMEDEEISTVQVVLAPQSSLAGKTLRQINFREKYELSVLAIYRAGRTYRSDLRDMPIRFGDALLVFGRRGKLNLLADEPDFLVLTEKVKAPPLSKKAPISGLIMAGAILSVAVGWLPIEEAAVTGVALMVLSGCLTMAEAYRAIEWKAIFLIAGMLPLGIAMQNTGTARFFADQVISLTEPYGGTILIAGLFLLTLLASQIMPNPVVIVLMAPIALTTAADLGYSPYTLMMAIAIAASSSFLSPVGHPANVLIMGPGGYKFRDYFKVGLPLVIVSMVITLLLLPVFWPLTP